MPPHILHARVWYIRDIVSRIYRKTVDCKNKNTGYMTHWIRSDDPRIFWQSIFTNAERKKIRALRDFERIMKLKITAQKGEQF